MHVSSGGSHHAGLVRLAEAKGRLRRGTHVVTGQALGRTLRNVAIRRLDMDRRMLEGVFFGAGSWSAKKEDRDGGVGCL